MGYKDDDKDDNEDEDEVGKDEDVGRVSVLH